MYEKNAEECAVEVIVAKQCNGPTGTVPLTFMKKYTRFESHIEEEVSFGEADDA